VATVIITPAAQTEFDDLPLVIRARVGSILVRIAGWPDVSGAKPLRGELAGNLRIRTGAYRVVFRPSADGQQVTVWKIGHRGGVYD
jgi:mRNA-degrading endonuclease RelE of RelBE toxin-antitoxin system